MIVPTVKGKFYRIIAACLLFAGVLLVSPASAKADIITFELDPLLLTLPDGYRSVESSILSFRGSRASSLFIRPETEGEFFGTRGLAVESTPGVFMDFSVPVNSLSLWFGNDHPLQIEEGDTAILRVFMDGVFVGETTLRCSLQSSRYLIPRFLPHPLRRDHVMGGLSLLHLRLDHALLR